MADQAELYVQWLYRFNLCNYLCSFLIWPEYYKTIVVAEGRAVHHLSKYTMYCAVVRPLSGSMKCKR